MYRKGLFYITLANYDVKNRLIYDLVKVHGSKWSYNVYMIQKQNYSYEQTKQSASTWGTTQGPA